MSRIALVGPQTALGERLRAALAEAAIPAEALEFLAPAQPEGEHGMTEYDGAAEWVKSVVAGGLAKARLVLLCEPLPAGVEPGPDALVIDLTATLLGDAAVPLLQDGDRRGIRRFPAPAARIAAEALRAAGANAGAFITHLASGSERLAGGPFALMDEARKVLVGEGELEPAELRAFNVRPEPPDPAGEPAGAGLDPARAAWGGVACGQFHCGLLLIDLPGAADPALPARWPRESFASVQEAAGRAEPLVALERHPLGVRLRIAYDPYEAGLLPALLPLVRRLAADA